MRISRSISHSGVVGPPPLITGVKRCSEDMTLPGIIPRTPWRVSVFLLGVAFVASCFTLLRDGVDHLLIFGPLAALNLAVGSFASERVSRLFIIIELLAFLGWLAYEIIEFHGHHAP